MISHGILERIVNKDNYGVTEVKSKSTDFEIVKFIAIGLKS